MSGDTALPSSEASMPYELDDLEFESVALSEEHGRDFDEWVATRLSE